MSRTSVRYLLILVMLFYACTGGDRLRRSSTAAEESVEALLARLTLRQKIGQMFFYHLDTQFKAQGDVHWQKVEDLVRHHYLGGLHLWGGEPYATAYLTNRLQSVAEVPLLFTADLEHGAGRFGGTDFPHNMAIAAGGDEKAAYDMGLITGREGRSLGIHLTLAPVVDVNNNPANPIINVRSFGEDPQAVARFATAFIRGCHDGGMLATAKHFPGHGNTAEDSHIELALVPADSQALANVELVPFRAAIAAGVDVIMTAHLNVRGVPMNPYEPATISPEIMTGLLRRRLGFDGLLITDSMRMWAMSNNYTDAYATVRAVKAGVDIVLVQENVPEMITELEKRVRNGEIAAAQIESSARRILQAKARVGLLQNRFVHLDSLATRLRTAAAQRRAEELAQRAITLLKNRENLVPITPDTTSVAVVHLWDEAHPTGSQDSPFASELARFFPRLQAFMLSPDTHADEFNEVLAAVGRARVQVLPTYTILRAWKGHLGLPVELQARVQALVATGTPAVAVSFGNPYVYPQLAGAHAYVAAFGSSEGLDKAAARAVAGVRPITGVSPISLPGAFVRGDGWRVAARQVQPVTGTPAAGARLRYGFEEEGGFSATLRDSVGAIMQHAVMDSVFPGATLLIARHGLIVYHETFGNLGYGVFAHPVPLNAIYDLASVTKVVATTTACMMLYERGQLDLDAPVRKYLPGFVGEKKDQVTIRHLLGHCAGLVPFRRYFEQKRSAREIFTTIMQEPLEYAPAGKTAYSDLGFIMLGKIIEKVSGASLDTFCHENILRPLRMADTFFLPDSSVFPRLAPTEFDPWRGRVVHGQVHDENAWALGGVSGHAGLFSTARDLATFLQMLLNGGTYNGVRLLQPQTIALFTQRQNLVPGSSRALGWDTASGENAAGRLMSQRAFGHTGFTGTSAWVDPDRDLFVVLLSNRVHTTRANNRITKFRPLVHNAIMRAITD